LTCILVVEDDPWIQWVIADDLADRGYEIVSAQGSRRWNASADLGRTPLSWT
jgi:CheY-like chemotaxis protein